MIKTILSRLLVCLIVVSLFDGSVLFAQRKTTDESRPVISVENAKATAELVKTDDAYAAEFDLGELGVSTRVQLKLMIKNPLEEEVTFSDVSKKCSCSSFRARRYRIAPDEEEEIALTINTPARSRTPEVTQYISFVDDGAAVIRAELKFKLKGVLAFENPMGFMQFEADDESRELGIPFLITEPVKFDQLKASASENLKDLTFTMEPTKTGGVLKAKLPGRALRDGKLTGEIYISDLDGENKDCFFLVVKDLAKNEISPSVLSFRRKGDSISASAMVQVANRADRVPTSPIVCEFAGKKIPLQTRMLKKNFYQVRLQLDEELAKSMSAATEIGDEDELKPAVVVWSINNGMKTTTHKTAFIIDQD